MIITCSNSRYSNVSVKAEENNSETEGSTITVPLSQGEWTRGHDNDSRLEIFNEWGAHALPSALEGISFKGIDITFTVSGVGSILAKTELDNFTANLNFYSSDENIKNIVGETDNVSTRIAVIDKDGTYTVGYSGDTRITFNYYMAVRFTQLDSIGMFSGNISNVKLTLYDAVGKGEVSPKVTASPTVTEEPQVTGTPNYEAEQQTVGRDDDFRVGISYVDTKWKEVYYADFSTNQVMQVTGVGDYSIGYTAGRDGDLQMLWLDTNLYAGSRMQVDVTKVHLISADGSENTDYTVDNGGLMQPGSMWGYRNINKYENYAATVKNPYISYQKYVLSQYDNYKPEYTIYEDRADQIIDLFNGNKISVTSGSTITLDFTVRVNPDVAESPAPSVLPSSEPEASDMPQISVKPSGQPEESVTPDVTPAVTDDPDDFKINQQDIAALKELIRQQREKGATVDESPYSMEYGWNMDGRLIEIHWGEKAVYGDISLAKLPYLEEFYCGEGKLTSIDVKSNQFLKELFVGFNKLTSIDVSKNADLQMLSVAENQLTSLDTSNNIKLDTLWCQDNQLDVVYVNQTISESSIYKDSKTKIVRRSPGEMATDQPTGTPVLKPTISPGNTPMITPTATPAGTPECTDKPQITGKPGDEPGTTNEPGESAKPGDQPGATGTPKSSNIPSESSKPQGTLNSTNTITPGPQKTNAPSETVQPKNKGSVLTDHDGIYKVVSESEEEPSVLYWMADSDDVSQAIIPNTVESKGVRYKVTSIAPGAFQNNKKLKSVVIGKNIVSIGKNAFKNCKNLKRIVIRSEKLKVSKIASNILKGTNKKLVIKVPKNKWKQYKKFLKKCGNKKVRIIK